MFFNLSLIVICVVFYGVNGFFNQPALRTGPALGQFLKAIPVISPKQIVSGITDSVSSELAVAVVKQLCLPSGAAEVCQTMICDVATGICRPLSESVMEQVEQYTVGDLSDVECASKVMKLSITIPEKEVRVPLMLQQITVTELPMESALVSLKKTPSKVSIKSPKDMVDSFSLGRLTAVLTKNVLVPLVAHSLIHALSGASIHALAAEGLKLF